jgi:prepilin-type N-terminal cleavage/methylation domain-containing protein
MFKAKRGFTLIELLIVIVIIGILAGIVVGIVGTSANNKAQDAKQKAIVHEVQNALEQYFLDNNSTYPAGADAAAMKTALTGAELLSDSTNVDLLFYDHTADPEGYTLYFVLKNQNDNSTDNIRTVDASKQYYVTAKQQ